MAQTITLYKIFVASPSDLSDERSLLEEVIDELNISTFNNSDIKVELIKWETHANPDIGEYPQNVINKDIGNNYDIFIGILWSKFGSATPNYKSGTEEEFYNAYKRYRESHSVKIMFYFKQEPIPIDLIDPESIKSIRKFKSELGEKGLLYWDYNTTEEFQKLLRIQLARKIQELNQVSKDKPVLIEKVEVVPELEDELGIIDYIENGTEYFDDIEDIILRMTDSIEWIGKRFNERTEEINKHTILNPQMGTKTKKRLINAAAEDMQSFNSRLKVEVPLFSEKYQKGIDCFSNALKLGAELKADEIEDIENTIEAIMFFISSISSSRQTCIEFRDSMNEFPRMTKELNHAKRISSSILTSLIDEFETAINLAEALQTEFEEYKKKY
ncbi:MAG: hypothetical protein ACD_19C00373G0002 [uncultured bacterium]|nr:MAG: hypothetical protein ACD_19C00373G0002 [uncultured bacterium]